jgi:muramoyltetrapeptide carboxypeptidase
MSRRQIIVVKPKALTKGSSIGLFSPASPVDRNTLEAGIVELRRLGFNIHPPADCESVGYFAGTHEERMMEFVKGTQKKGIDGLVATRGGYGTSHLFDNKFNSRLLTPKCIVGFSDVTALQVYVWQVRQWITTHGPMAAAGFAAGPGKPGGYEESSFLQAVQNTKTGWRISLQGESMNSGTTDGRLLGGCLTILQTTIGTPWELDTEGTILLLEDAHMKPYQVDRALMHLMQAGKFQNVRGMVLGDFPGCDPPVKGSPTVQQVCERILRPLDVPIVFGAPIGHTKRAMLTIPLGVRARLDATGEGTLEILEPAVID